MDSRVKNKKKPSVSRTDAIRAFVLVSIVGSVPILGAIFLVISTVEPDLTEFSPLSRRLGDYLVLDWSALNQGQPASGQTEVLGYMIDTGRPASEGEWVRNFVLVPEPGNIFHPAHQDVMVTVHLEGSERIQFSPKALVWAWGNLQPDASLLNHAHAKLADKADIRKYFK